ncbi:hypothetical protein UFOVP393_27 [uncultured Caudovirales phage]|uniref:Uncharacterized protein n=1 Tax=uncultured Caudovirales phage TaxID=2100421 RepID=A0A6J7X3Y6_9CAUD|nr:hypothetical protein UFOVP393_27 [uncultured Caudovirales phage]
MAFGFGFGFGFNGGGGGGGGPTLDLDFLLGTLPSTVTFTRSSTATYFTSTGALATAAINEPRFDYNPATLALRGLLIEEQRTNSIRNNTAVGAVAGTPGTLPTNWGSVVAGLTQTVVGTGVEDGINYIDIRFNGTTTGTSLGVRFESNTGVAVASGQTWTASTFCRRVGGSITNVASSSIGLSGLTSAGVLTTDSTSASLTPVLNMTNLETTRTSRALTFADATTAYARVQVIVSFLVGAAIDITLRIGLPQLELGAFATSVIPTTGAAATRAGDSASMTGTNFSSWHNATEGALYAAGLLEALPSLATNQLAAISDGTNNNRIQLGASTASSGNINLLVTSAGVTQANPLVGSLGTTGPHKSAGAYATNSFQVAVNGALGTEDTSGSVPSSLSVLNIGAAGNLNTKGNLWIQRITYYPRRLSNAELQVITT